MHRSLVLAISFALALTAGVPAQQAAPRPGLTVEQALALRSVTNPCLGDDFVAFTLVVPRPIADGPGGAYQHLGVIDGLGKLQPNGLPAPRWLVDGKQTAPGMQVRPGQREVSYLRAVDGSMQLFVQSIDGGEARQWAKTAAIAGYSWRPDGEAVSFTALDPAPEARASAQARGFKPVVVDEDWRHVSLWLVTDGGESKQLTNGTTVFDYEWAPDGSKLACACAPRNLVDDSYMFTRLFVLDVATGELTKLVDNPGKLGAFAWSPHHVPLGSKLAYVTAADRNDPHAGAVVVLDVASGVSELRAGPFMVEALQWVQLEPGMEANLLTLVARGTQSALLIDRHGALGPRVPDGAAITAMSARGERIAYTASAATHPAELFLGDDMMRGASPGGRRLSTASTSPRRSASCRSSTSRRSG